MAKSVEEQLKRTLNYCSDRVKGVAETASREAAEQTAERLRSTSPKGPKGYAGSWTVSKKSRGDYVVHNKKHYRLTHLLENSHWIINGKGVYGRTSVGNGQVIHIKPAETFGINEYERVVEEGINKI